MIERIEGFVTELPVRLQRTFSSGSYDTGPPKELLGKPVFVKIYANGVVGHAQIRPISPGHFVADTVHSVVAAITEVFGPLLIGRKLSDIEAIGEALDARHRHARCTRQGAGRAGARPDRRMLRAAHPARMVSQPGGRRVDHD